MILIRRGLYANRLWWNKHRNRMVQIYQRYLGAGTMYQMVTRTGTIKDVKSSYVGKNHSPIIIQLEVSRNDNYIIRISDIESVCLLSKAETIVFKLETENKN